jgi:hypothetical protein
MIMETHSEVDHHRWWTGRRWSMFAVLWSAVYLVAAVCWNLGAPKYPYGRHWDPSPLPVSLLDGVSAQLGTTIMIIATAAMLVATLWLLVGRRPGVLARIASAVVCVGCLGLVLVGDYRPLMAVARTPVFIISNLVWGIGDGVIDIGTFTRAMFSVPAMHGFWQLAGILLLLLTLREFWTRASDGCSECGRPEPMPGWTTRSGARRWGLVATIVAVACPLPYAITRYLLLLGIPADGFSAAQIRQMNAEAPGIWIFGAGLATFGVLGAVLTLGLVQRWGERWPFWVPVLRGRPINPLVAIIPAGFVALLLPGSSGMLLRLHIHRALNANSGEGSGLLGLIVAPMNLWLFWGFALAAATLAYWLRRRPDCPTCNRGVEPMRGVWRRQDPPAGGDS